MAKEMFDKMIEDLERVENILKNSKATGKIPDIERDIMLSKLRIIYEFLLLYQPEIVKEKNISPKKDEVKPSVVLETKSPEPIQIKTEPKSEPEEKAVPKPEPHPETIPTPEKPGKPVISAAPTTILAEKFITEKSFLNEVLTQYANTYDIAKKFQNSPINDIFTAIGINEKFLFIKELFSNNAELYQRTIEQLNLASDFNEAIEYIDKNFTWNFESTTVHNLLELIRRRHPIDRE
jgi:hypothetical protein